MWTSDSSSQMRSHGPLYDLIDKLVWDRWLSKCSEVTLVVAMLGLIIHTARPSSGQCKGISASTQVLLLSVFATRYLDIFWTWYTVYTNVMKIIYLSLATITVALLAYRQSTNEGPHPEERKIVATLAITSFVLSLLLNYQFRWEEIAWSFSQYLAVGVMLPQGFKFKMNDHAADVPLWYTGLMAFYRLPMLLALSWKMITGDFVDLISLASATLQICVSTAVFIVHKAALRRAEHEQVDDGPRKPAKPASGTVTGARSPEEEPLLAADQEEA